MRLGGSPDRAAQVLSLLLYSPAQDGKHIKCFPLRAELAMNLPAPPPAAAPHPLRVEWADEKLRSPRSRSVAWHAHRGKLVPEFTSGMGCGFRLWPRWETASHSDHKFRVTFSAKASTGNRVPFLSRILGCIFR